MKTRRLALLLASFLLAACGDAVDSGPGGSTKPTLQELADASCDAFSKNDVPSVNGTANPPEVVTADGTLKEMTLGPVEEPAGHVGVAKLHVEEAGRYALVVYEDSPAASPGTGYFRELEGGPVPAGFQGCSGCATSCKAVSVTGSYDLAVGDYEFLARNDTHSTVRFVLAPIAAQ